MFTDFSTGDGTIITFLNQSIKGAGRNLKACTDLMTRYQTSCKSALDFAFVDYAWGAGSYNRDTDTYSLRLDVSAGRSFPFGKYFTRLMMENGETAEVFFEPKLTSQLRWVFTTTGFCSAPTQPAAPVGGACNQAGETKSNSCGTLTCMAN